MNAVEKGLPRSPAEDRKHRGAGCRVIICVFMKSAENTDEEKHDEEKHVDEEKHLDVPVDCSGNHCWFMRFWGAVGDWFENKFHTRLRHANRPRYVRRTASGVGC